MNTLACREGGNGVGEHWHIQRVLANYFFACRVVRLEKEPLRVVVTGLGLPSHGSSHDGAMLWVHDKIFHLKLAAYFIMHEPTHCITGQHNLL